MVGISSFISSNFAPAFYCMPAGKRRALGALYAFCHEVDCIVDGGMKKESALEQLKVWEDKIVCGKTDDNSFAWVDTFRINKVHLLNIVEGVKLDLVKQRYATYDELRDYAYKVASSVGLAALYIFGVPEAEGEEFAVNLGLAFQMTNILRDIREDACRGRIYMPLEDMKRFNVTEEDIVEGIYSRRFVSLMRFEAARTRGLFETALAYLPGQYERELKPAVIMSGIYHRLLEKIEQSGYDVLRRRIKLSLWEKYNIWQKR